MRTSRAVTFQFSLLAVAAIASLALPAQSPIQRTDPPAAAGAVSPGLAATASGFLLSWIEPAGDGNALRYARFEESAWSEPRTIASGTDVLANWARSPAMAESSAGWLLAAWAAKAG